MLVGHVRKITNATQPMIFSSLIHINVANVYQNLFDRLILTEEHRIQRTIQALS